MTTSIGLPFHFRFSQVYRYMPSQYVDEFFNEGKLLLSSFKKFRGYPDEIRGDKTEGNGCLSAVGDERPGETQVHLHVVTQFGNNSYVLCTSMLRSRKIADDFGCDSCFLIKNPLGFSFAVGRTIQGFSEATYGFCNYVSSRRIKKDMPDLSVKDLTNENGALVVGFNEPISELMGSGPDLMFLKHEKYQEQAEFRFIWNVDNHYDMEESKAVVCKEAIQYCERAELP